MKTKRINFTSITHPVYYKDFLNIQIKSFKEFFQLDTKIEDRKKEGLFKVFKDNFPIYDAKNNFVLEFIDYNIDNPRYSIDYCIERGLTYCISLKAKLKLSSCNEQENKEFKPVCQDVYLGTYPYMTPSGSFIFNGAERVIVSQLHRSPGVFFGQSYHANGTKLYSARIIPFKGSWIEFTTDINNVIYAYIDRKKKLPLTTLLRSIGYEKDEDILNLFDIADKFEIKENNFNEILGRKLAGRVLHTWYEDIVDEETGKIISIQRNKVILDRDIILEENHFHKMMKYNIKYIYLHKKNIEYSLIYNTLRKDNTNSEKEAIEYIYRQLRNAEPPDHETAKNVIDKLFFLKIDIL